jgi:hypothetical protein
MKSTNSLEKKQARKLLKFWCNILLESEQANDLDHRKEVLAIMRVFGKKNKI